MKGEKKKQLLSYIAKNGAARPNELAQFLKISAQALHRHLKELLENKEIQKKGAPPLVYYEIKKIAYNIDTDFSKISEDEKRFIKENYSRLLPNGELLQGLEAFRSWLLSTQQLKSYPALATAFIKLHQDIYHKKNKNNIFNVTVKLKTTFSSTYLNEVFCSDFYSLPQFGKTYLGNLITAGKSGQNKRAIEEIAEIVKKDIITLIHEHKIQALAWAPHSIPRKIMFLNQLKKYLKIDLPQIEIVKIFSGNTPIAQKSLTKLEDRITNARETTIIKNFQANYQRILIIDDAIGSGATLNEIAKKLKDKIKPDILIGYSIVASYKGFDVISVI